MSTTYKGDSPGKKLSRFRTWVLCLQAARSLNVPYQGCLVLAGEGGDLSVLDALDVPLRTVTAVDYDKDWVDFCRDAYPGCRTVHGELGASSRLAKFNMAHLDFCGGLSAPNLRTITDVCWNVKALPSIVAVTMLKGRESRQGSHARSELIGPEVGRRTRRRNQLLARKQGNAVGEYVLSTPKLSPGELLRIAEKQFRGHMPNRYKEGVQGPYLKNGTLSPLGTAMVRACAVQSSVEWLGSLRGDFPGDGPNLTCVGVVGYHSKTKKGHGTPFMTAVYAVTHPLRRDLVHQILLENPGNFMFDSLDSKASMSQLPPTAAELAKVLPAEKVGKMFDVPAKTVIAWKAHASRGTYKAKPLFRAVDPFEVTARPTLRLTR